jgi:hypothetical protein
VTERDFGVERFAMAMGKVVENDDAFALCY